MSVLWLKKKIFILGREIINKRETFNYPLSSEQIRIFVGDGFMASYELISIECSSTNIFYYTSKLNNTQFLYCIFK